MQNPLRLKGVYFSFILKDLNLQLEGSEMDICFALHYMKREDGGVFFFLGICDFLPNHWLKYR
jgi:hypothetical protein